MDYNKYKYERNKKENVLSSGHSVLAGSLKKRFFSLYPQQEKKARENLLPNFPKIT